MVKYKLFYSFIFWISCINVRLKLFIAFYVIELRKASFLKKIASFCLSFFCKSPASLCGIKPKALK